MGKKNGFTSVNPKGQKAIFSQKSAVSFFLSDTVAMRRNPLSKFWRFFFFFEFCENCENVNVFDYAEYIEYKIIVILCY